MVRASNGPRHDYTAVVFTRWITHFCAGDWFLTGFSPRVPNLTLYLMGGFDPELLKKLGKYISQG